MALLLSTAMLNVGNLAFSCSSICTALAGAYWMAPPTAAAPPPPSNPPRPGEKVKSDPGDGSSILALAEDADALPPPVALPPAPTATAAGFAEGEAGRTSSRSSGSCASPSAMAESSLKNTFSNSASTSNESALGLNPMVMSLASVLFEYQWFTNVRLCSNRPAGNTATRSE